MYKFINTDFESVMKNENKMIACEHEILVEELNKQPMMFKEFLVNICYIYSEYEIRKIFLESKWYSVEKENNIIDFSIYLNKKHQDADISYTYADDELIDLNEEIVEELNNVLDKLDAKIENMVIEDIIKSFNDISKVVDIKISDCNIDKDELDKLIKLYILNNNGEIYYENILIGYILYCKNNILKVKLVDNPLEITNTFKAYLELENYKNKNYIERICVKDDSENFIELDRDKHQCFLLSKEEINILLDNYIEMNGKVFLETYGILGDIISYNEDSIKIKLTNNEEILKKYNQIKNVKINLMLSQSNNDEYKINSVFAIKSCNDDNIDIIEFDMPKNHNFSEGELINLLDKYYKDRNGNVYIYTTNNIVGNMVYYNKDKIGIKLVNDESMLELFNNIEDKKIELVTIKYDLYGENIELIGMFIMSKNFNI